MAKYITFKNEELIAQFRVAGEFTNQDGKQVKYPEALKLSFADPKDARRKYGTSEIKLDAKFASIFSVSEFTQMREISVEAITFLYEVNKKSGRHEFLKVEDFQEVKESSPIVKKVS